MSPATRRPPSPHWVEVSLAGKVRGQEVRETVRVELAGQEGLELVMTEGGVQSIGSTARRIAGKRLGLHPCSTGRLAFGFSDWSDTVEAVAPRTP